jgi:acyl carrier protein
MDETAVRQAFAAVLSAIAPEVDPARLDPELPLREQVDLASIDYLNFIIALGEALRVEIPDADYERCGTLRGILDYFAAGGPAPLPQDAGS